MSIAKWKNAASHPPHESGRYLCVVEEQTDLGLSKFVWNCSYNRDDNLWSYEYDGRTVRWDFLPPL